MHYMHREVKNTIILSENKEFAKLAMQRDSARTDQQNLKTAAACPENDQYAVNCTRSVVTGNVVNEYE